MPIAILLASVLVCLPGAGPRVLFFTRSQGFVHDVVRRPAPEALAPAEAILTRALADRYELVCSQDCADLAPERLARLDALVFMTTGELSLPDEQRAALVEWVARGGAFVGLHCATDTLYEYAPYQAMLGGTFDGHPWHQRVGLRLEERAPAFREGLPERFELEDEIYQFRNFRRHPLRVVLSLDPSSVELARGQRADGDYALAWRRDWGEGRVFYCALGHGEPAWNDAHFLALIEHGLAWAIGGPDLAVAAPPGAHVLVDGAERAAWRGEPSGHARWRRVDDALEVVPGSGDLESLEEFGDALYHVEFRVPRMEQEHGQGRGNSGVYLQGRYELQVLDSYGLEAAVDGCGALYGQRAPDVNATRPPERWQSYDIEFTAPRFDAQGTRTAAARASVWLNGRLVHDDVELAGPTAGGVGAEAPLGPLRLQDHGDPVRYRAVWVLPR